MWAVAVGMGCGGLADWRTGALAVATSYSTWTAAPPARGRRHGRRVHGVRTGYGAQDMTLDGAHATRPHTPLTGGARGC